MNIQAFFLGVRNVWKQVFRFFERRWKRNLLWTTLLIIFFVLGMWVQAAWASERPSVRLSVREINYELTPISRLQRERSDWVSSTTTTTTTTTTKPAPPKAVQSGSTTTLPPVKQAPQGDWVAQCHAWAAQAGIELPPAAITLIGRESSCNPNAQNPHSSACGIAQNIRGCNSEGYGYDPVQQLKWFHSYCFGRYGSFEAALDHSYSKGWY